MVTSCPQNYLIESIKSRCGYFDYESANNDLSLMTPVTNSKYKITFANSYCAMCNGIDSFNKWQVELKCDPLGPVEEPTTSSTFSTSTSSIVIFPSANRKKRVHHLRKKSVSTKSSAETNAKEAAKYAKYDPKKKIFVSMYNGENYKCAYKRNADGAFKSAVRYCYPAIGECSDFSNKTLVQLCDQSATTIVYNKVKYYRNPECALCNGVKDSEPLGCFDLGNRIGASSLFTAGGNKGGSEQSPQKFCDKLGQRGQNKVC